MANLQRESEILRLLKQRGYATVAYLSRNIHTSPSSIRRDLTHLESQGLVKRDHGGASLFPVIPGMAPFFSRLREQAGKTGHHPCGGKADQAKQHSLCRQLHNGHEYLPVHFPGAEVARLHKQYDACAFAGVKKDKNILYRGLHFAAQRCDHDGNLRHGNAEGYLCRLYVLFLFGTHR